MKALGIVLVLSFIASVIFGVIRLLKCKWEDSLFVDKKMPMVLWGILMFIISVITILFNKENWIVVLALYVILLIVFYFINRYLDNND